MAPSFITNFTAIFNDILTLCHEKIFCAQLKRLYVALLLSLRVASFCIVLLPVLSVLCLMYCSLGHSPGLGGSTCSEILVSWPNVSVTPNLLWSERSFLLLLFVSPWICQIIISNSNVTKGVEGKFSNWVS